MNRNFQINLRGLIDLLSNHLYSSPDVFLRELLQNAVDALHARRLLKNDHAGEITIRLVSGERPTLVFADNGIGLTEDEVHRFLATIGSSSKRENWTQQRNDFIGQFGIGILACFMVADEIVVLTRSARPGSVPVEWRGNSDGTYSVRALESDLSPGTQVFLRSIPGREEFFAPDRVRTLLRHFGGLLPYPIRLEQGDQLLPLGAEPVPWRQRHASERERRQKFLEYGQAVFDMRLFDAIPIFSSVGDVEGIACILPWAPGPATRQSHRIYLKNMFLTDNGEHLLPEWAFFVKCILNCNELQPTASREAFYENETLEHARAQIGRCIRDYLVRLAREDQATLRRLISLHFLSFKALAAVDEEFYRMFIEWLPFETSLGTMSMGDFLARQKDVRYTVTVEEFRQISQVALAVALPIINAGYIYDLDLLERLRDVHPGLNVERIDTEDLVQEFEDLDLPGREDTRKLLGVADRVLATYGCRAEIKNFLPADLPALYSIGREALHRRSLEQTREIADGLWSGILGNLSADEGDTATRLCFNYNNALVRAVCRAGDESILELYVKMIYVQSLLLGHHPLQARELQLLNEGLGELLLRGLANGTG